MDADRIARLTEQQRICLRFVYSHLTSKEIAPHLGIEPGSVDQHIKTAMRTLDVGDRRTAAVMLARYEGLHRPQPLVYQPLDIAMAPEPATFAPSIERGRQRYGGSSAEAMREEQAVFEIAPPPPFRGLRPPLPIWGGRPNDLNSLRRLGWIFAIILVIALSFGVFLAGLEALSRLGRTISF